MSLPRIKIDAELGSRQAGTTSFARALSPGEPWQGTLAPADEPTYSSHHSSVSSLGLRHGRSSSQVSLLEKPLPSPHTWGRLSMRSARTSDKLRRYLRHASWLPQSGWRSTVMAGAGLAVSILIINLVILAWASSKPIDTQTGTRTLWQGDCTNTHNTFTFTHLAINVCSTLLLGTSNAAMQCLSAPTREAVDRAHAKGHWLDIGISGFRNWTSMDRWRKWCWILLALSTIPLHLLYNSAIFQTTSANEYYALAVSSDFLDRDLNSSIGHGTDQTDFDGDVPPDNVLSELSTLARNNALKPMGNQECLQTYSSTLLSDFSNVLLVLSNRTENVTARYFIHYPTPPNTESTATSASDPDWICGQTDEVGASSGVCNFDQQIALYNSWNFTIDPAQREPGLLFVDHCLVQETIPQCTIQLIPEVMGVVIVCNVIKVACFIFAAYARGFQPLITLGDALSSFLQRPDPTTRDFGPLSASDVRNGEDRVRLDLIRGRATGEVPLQFGPWRMQRRRWFTGASRLRWGMTYVMMISLWIVGIIFLVIALLFSTGSSLTDQWKSGLGNATGKLLLTLTSSLGVIGNIVVANSPQLLLSVIYVSYNGLFTCILISHEFSGYARRRAPLRVSAPNGLQRGTYFLSLPYRYALPLLILAGVLHWALSQSIFLAEIKVFTPSGAIDPQYSVSCLGYSTLGLLVTILLGGIMVITPLVICLRYFRGGAPLLESNSLAMSAACQLDQGCDQAVVKYGARGGQVGLSSGSVEPLVTGDRYTRHEELDMQQYEIKAVLKFLPLRQKILLGVAVVLALGKAGLAVPTNLFLGSQSVVMITSAVLLPMTLLYMFTRMCVAIHRVRKKRVIRRFAWHVAPEIVFMIFYFVIWGISAMSRKNLTQASTSDPAAASPSVFSSDNTAQFAVDTIVALTLNAVVWLLSVVVEGWMWLDQLQYSLSSLPNGRPRKLGLSSRAEA